MSAASAGRGEGLIGMHLSTTARGTHTPLTQLSELSRPVQRSAPLLPTPTRGRSPAATILIRLVIELARDLGLTEYRRRSLHSLGGTR